MVRLNNQSKQEHFDSFNPFRIESLLGRAVSCTFLTSIHLVAQKNALNENGEIMTENIKIANSFNFYFELVTDSLELFDWSLQSNISYG